MNLSVFFLLAAGYVTIGGVLALRGWHLWSSPHLPAVLAQVEVCHACRIGLDNNVTIRQRLALLDPPQAALALLVLGLRWPHGLYQRLRNSIRCGCLSRVRRALREAAS